MPLTVTIIVTNYNHAPLLEGAVRSVLAQTRPAERVIVYDDASTDASQQVLARLPKFIEVVQADTNCGVVAARNAGLKLVETDLVVFLDADDELLPEFLAATLRAWRRASLYHHRLAIVYTPARVRNGDSRGYMHSHGFNKWRLAERNYIPNTSLILRAAIVDVGGYSDEMATLGHEDWDLFLGIVERGWSAELVARPLFLYRTLPESRNQQSLARGDAVREAISKRHPWTGQPQPRVTGVQRLGRAAAALRQAAWRHWDRRSWSKG